MLTRHRLLAGVSALVAASLALPAAAQDTIKIGEMNSYKIFAAFLEPYKKGMELAVDEVNAAGGVLGPMLLMYGLTRTAASSASLLLNLEGLATMGIAWLVIVGPWLVRNAVSAGKWGLTEEYGSAALIERPRPVTFEPWIDATPARQHMAWRTVTSLKPTIQRGRSAKLERSTLSRRRIAP